MMRNTPAPGKPLAQASWSPVDARDRSEQGASVLSPSSGPLPVQEGREHVELARAFDELRHALREAEERESQNRMMARGVAHDLRNLLLVISAHADFVLGALPDEHPMQEELRRILSASARATVLTSSLMVRAVEDSRPLVPLSLAGAIVETCELLEPLCGSDFTLVQRLRAAGRVRIEPSQFERVLINLTLNARDAMPEGGTIVLETEDVRLTAADSQSLQLEPGAYVLLRVTDSGIGMGPETRASLFRPYFTTKPPGQGAGLGLATVVALIERAGGALDVESEPGVGTSFRVFLPAVLLDSARPSRAASAGDAQQPACASVEGANIRHASEPAASGCELEVISCQQGHVVLGWAAPGVLFASFHGRLSDAIGAAYAERLRQLLEGRRGVRYFLDASHLGSFELVGRTVAMRALVSSVEALASVLVLNWAGGESTTARSLLQQLSLILRVTFSRAEFEDELLRFAPLARAVIERAAAFHHARPDELGSASAEVSQILGHRVC